MKNNLLIEKIKFLMNNFLRQKNKYWLYFKFKNVFILSLIMFPIFSLNFLLFSLL